MQTSGSGTGKRFAGLGLLAGLAMAFGLAAQPGCSSGGGGGGGGPVFDEALAAEVVEQYVDLMAAMYSDSVVTAETLHDAIDTLLATPSDGSLTAAKNAWIAARRVYQQTEVARFYQSPIDDADGPEGSLNAWPLNEAHIDYVHQMPGVLTSSVILGGIINLTSTFPTITTSTLRDQNENPTEEDIATGWHAIEFLLWGQDDPNEATGTGGMRPFADFDLSAGSPTSTGEVARRRTYLELAADLLLEDLISVRDEWTTGGAYRAEMLSLPVAVAVARIFTGIGSLGNGELRGERLLVPFLSKLPEDEHSCFSDTTHEDHFRDVLGIRNVWMGDYTSSDGANDTSGAGLIDLVASVNGILSSQMTGAIQDALDALDFLVHPELQPFDQAILGADTAPGRVQLQAAIGALEDFNDSISAVAAALGISVQTELQN